MAGLRNKLHDLKTGAVVGIIFTTVLAIFLAIVSGIAGFLLGPFIAVGVAIIAISETNVNFPDWYKDGAAIPTGFDACRIFSKDDFLQRVFGHGCAITGPSGIAFWNDMMAHQFIRFVLFPFLSTTIAGFAVTGLVKLARKISAESADDSAGKAG